MNRKEWTAYAKERAARLYGCGFSLRDVADDIGVSYELVRRWLIEAGVPMRAKWARVKDDDADG